MAGAAGAEAFQAHYSELYGPRWPALRAALLAREKQVLRECFHAEAAAGEAREIPWLPGALWYTEERKDWPARRTPEGLLRYYVMDPASALAARALRGAPGERILDLCAAPGGKTLVLLESGASVVANEPSRPRRDRLTAVIRQYATAGARARVEVRGKDGARIGMGSPAAFDAVLVDAPCSGERHLLGAPAELARWSAARGAQLARRQYALLASALLALRPGGRLVYSTCALSPQENDEVVARLLKKKEGEVEPMVSGPAPSPFAERTALGWMHLPDRAGFGPLYYAELRRL
ncbi:MAG: RsmB/NOP family class I SAM-dependent RNA methyltransferase [Bdellovibrionales bacterium]|nr:RsmB/NOP family class I SAM-dependent RNA methyltransferase [Bdellovibrionales bacterium]